ncbi:MAG: hypothetical protein IKN81_00170 [Oscillospiraceae bacterium]|nr:hypothetical protein [Oscillospiraceae bacterium]
MEGIADGSVDLSDAISRGEVQAQRGVRLLGEGSSADLPANTGSGEVTATDGKYTASYISGSDFEASHSFDLIDPDNKTWYTRDTATDAVEVTLTCDDTASCLEQDGPCQRIGCGNSP